MSGDLIQKAWRATGLKPSEKLTLLFAADIARDEHGRRMWCKSSLIAAATGLSQQSIKDALRSLVAAGHLSRVVRPGTTTIYTVHPVASEGEIYPQEEIYPGSISPPGEGKKHPEGEGKFHPGEGVQTTLLTIIEPSIEPPSEPTEIARKPTTIDPEWNPGQLSESMAGKIAHWSPERTAIELAKFINHHSEKRTESPDWDARWRRWILNGLSYEEKRNENQRSPAGQQARSFGTFAGQPHSNPRLRAAVGFDVD